MYVCVLGCMMYLRQHCVCGLKYSFKLLLAIAHKLCVLPERLLCSILGARCVLSLSRCFFNKALHDEASISATRFVSKACDCAPMTADSHTLL